MGPDGALATDQLHAGVFTAQGYRPAAGTRVREDRTGH